MLNIDELKKTAYCFDVCFFCRSMLPSYRPAPDYETAVQQKYSQPTNNLRGALLYSSQPEIHQTHLQEVFFVYILLLFLLQIFFYTLIS